MAAGHDASLPSHAASTQELTPWNAQSQGRLPGLAQQWHQALESQSHHCGRVTHSRLGHPSPEAGPPRPRPHVAQEGEVPGPRAPQA